MSLSSDNKRVIIVDSTMRDGAPFSAETGEARSCGHERMKRSGPRR